MIRTTCYNCAFFFFFQAEDGIRDHCVTGVQTCALPISRLAISNVRARSPSGSGGVPITNENSGTMPWVRIRLASSIVSADEALPPLFIVFSTSSDPDSAPEKTIFSPESAIDRHVASEYCINVSM